MKQQQQQGKIAGNLDTIKEKKEAAMSSGYSLNSSSSNTYSFGDFRMYDDYHGRQNTIEEDVLDLDGHSPEADTSQLDQHDKSTNIQGVFKQNTAIETKPESTRDLSKGRRRQSQVNELIRRRGLTPYISKRLLEQAGS